MRYKSFNMKIILRLILIICSSLMYACATNMDLIMNDDSETVYDEYVIYEDLENIDVEDILFDEDIKRVEQIKSSSTGLLKKAFDIEEQHRNLTLNETRQLLGILNDRFQKSGLSVIDFEERVLKRIHRDLEIINAFNKELENITDCKNDVGCKLCRQNQLQKIISGSEDVVKEHIGNMVKGILPEEFERSLSKMTRLERSKEEKIISGSFKTTCFKGAIVTMLAALNGERANASMLDLPQKRNKMWADYSIVFHTIPLPEKMNTSSIHPDFKSFTYYYKSAASPARGELGIPHSGYYPDGNGARNPQKSIANPEDCSSWVFHQALNVNYGVTSYDMMQFFRIKTGVGRADRNYVKNLKYVWLNSAFAPVVVTPNKQTLIKPGDLLCIRRPEEQGVVVPDEDYGISGHVAIALFATDTYIVALACTRDVPVMEGIGVQKLSLEREKNSDIMVLRHK